MGNTNSLTNARRSTSAKLAGLELPLAFQLSTISSAELAITRRAPAKARRRAVDKATRLASKGSL